MIRRSYLAMPLLILCFASCTRQKTIVETSGGNNITTILSRTGEANRELVTTISRIIRLSNGNVQYNFNESQVPFVVQPTHPAFSRVLALATEAVSNRKPVKLIYSSYNQLEDLTWPSGTETSAYLTWYRQNITQPEGRKQVSAADLINPNFNNVSWQKWKVFAICLKPAPSLDKVKEIFNYCAAQGCYLGPTQEQPCIPFEFVLDGCFARAHKMRKIIQEKFGLCTEKVFSYGALAVTANKWGGCCVQWVYHVAPLIRVQTANGLKCYVIDPGMYNEPVLLSTWLSAQSNNDCNAQALVTDYTIQPSSAYTPAWDYEHQQYSTDGDYSKTNQALIMYNAYGNTCD